MQRLAIAMKVCEAIQKLQDNGWFKARIKGSHRQFKHPAVSGLVTITGKRSQDIPVGTVRRIREACPFWLTFGSNACTSFE